VEVGGRTLTTRAIVIAAGARPLLPPIPGLADVQPLTSDSIWNLRVRPGRLLVLGGGPIGCELSQAFQRLGCQVILVEQAERLLGREDEDASTAVTDSLRAEGVDLRLGHRAERFETINGQRRMVARQLGSGEAVSIDFDELLVALGRVANVEGYGVEELGLVLRGNHTLETDEFLATRYPNIFAVGDVTGPYQFTHFAAHQAWYAAVNALFGDFHRLRADYRVIPRVTFTDPELAQVGLSEAEAREQGVAFEVTRYDLAELDRAIAEEASEGFVKVLTVPGSDRILGATLVGEQAGELLAEFALAMRHKLGLNKILGTIHAYPTLAEANKYAAGEWKRAHAPLGLLRLLARFHHWRLGRGGRGGRR
jgi:pyruvate/2-oxoglutarate dehydrogenase complex dihydrolipoamide dehydrogenase (E3) component